MNPTEIDLVARLRTGDEAAYETLFRTHAGAMHAVARKFLGDTDEAADAVQDAFLSAFRNIATFEGSSQIGTWLHRITVNCCLMKLRSRKCRTTTSLEDAPIPVSRDDEPSILRAETSCRVRAAIAQLPEAYRTILYLRDLEGIDTTETANRLGTNETVVKVRLHRARHALKAILEPELATLMS